MENDNETVSVYMLCYNHAKWIEQAIRGVIKQKTNFTFKLYIHDDASTDGSQKIVKKYAIRYPDKIEAILQVQNQYSQNERKITDILHQKMKGKYIAVCEGDDCWIDENKLQMQYEYMTQHPKCSFCFTDAIMVDPSNEYCSGFFNYFWKDKNIIAKLKKDSDFSVDDMLKLGFTPTASHMMSRQAYEKYVGFPTQLDLSMRLVSTEIGYAHFICRKCVAYRKDNPNSASGTAKHSFNEYYNLFYLNHKRIYEQFNEYTNGRFIHSISKASDRELVLTYIPFLTRQNYKKFTHLKSYKDLRTYRKIRYLMKVIVKG